MPRPPRLHVPGGCYHVTLRGNHREALFESPADRLKLNEIVADAADRFEARIHAFCWMTNHLHALVQIADEPLGKLVQNITVRYSRYRHRALDTTGHLFERRHGAKLIQVESYFLAVLRYVHLNPVKARIVGEPSAYRWSSHRAYLGAESIDWVTTDLGLSLLAQDLGSARRAYAELVVPGAGGDENEPETHPDDGRILGGDDFVAAIKRSSRPVGPSAADALERRNEPRLAELGVRICADHGVSVETLRSASRCHLLTPIRLELLEQAVATRVATLTDVARYLGRNPSTLSRLRRKARPPIGPNNATMQRPAPNNNRDTNRQTA